MMMKSTHQRIADTTLARRMLEISLAAVAVVDRDGTVLFVNEGLSQLLGFPREDLIGHSSQRFLPDTPLRDFAAHMACPLSGSGQDSAIVEKPLIAKCKDGTIVPVNVSLHRIAGSRGSLLLAHLIRTDQRLADRELLESERLAAITQMASGLAHESRNALQRAVACLDLLELDLKDNPEQMVLAQRIRDSLADLLENYDEVRRYAEPIVVKRQRVKLLHICQIAFNELAVGRDNAAHRLGFLYSEESNDVVHVDREKMKLVFRHVLENAIDASSYDSCIDVGCERIRWHDAEAVKLTIRDHGCGFDKESLRQAFEPFYTTKQHGTGLGLAICRRIVEAHTGEIRAANHAGGGAVIKISMPVHTVGEELPVDQFFY